MTPLNPPGYQGLSIEHSRNAFDKNSLLQSASKHAPGMVTMNEHSYLIFELGSAHYGMATIAVQEIFLLPEIIPTLEAAFGVIGMVNVRGDILPILDLHRVLGRPSLPLQLTDWVIVVQGQGQRTGIVVQNVHNVQAIAPDTIHTPFTYQPPTQPSFSLIGGIATLESTLITLINPASLGQFIAGIEPGFHPLDESNSQGIKPLPMAEYNLALYDHLSLEARQQLKERSHRLSQTLTTQDDKEWVSVAVLELEGEYFGVGLELVHELIDIHKLTPIPCCPPHILGNMNLRGEIVTLIDISRTLNLPSYSKNSRRKAIVAQWNDSNIGIAVDDIVDVLNVNTAQIVPTPIAVHSIVDDYLQGVAAYHDKMMSLINLPKVLMDNSLVVDEEV